jgi:D-methionine transport system substrate-binding protein
MSEKSSTPPSLPERPRSSARPIIISLAAVLAVGLAAWLLIANLGGSSDDAVTSDDADRSDEAGAETAEPASTEIEPADGATVRIGTTDISQPHWEILGELAAAEGIELEFVGFSEYTQPNPALAQGEIELNSFQHILYLADHNNNTGDDLQPIGSTLIVPLPLYSEQYTSVEQFQPGDEVAIPNDATNQARALFVLEAAGLIAFTGDPAVPTPEDVDEAASTVSVVPVEASQTATLINQIAGVVVNNNFANDAGFDLSGYVYADDPSSPGAQPYINIFAARPDEIDNPVYQRIVELYHEPSVLDAVVESSGGTAVIVDGYGGDDLREILAETEQNLVAAD